ncbi:probable folate-biopterin transporter 8, chloroplastic isoform X1 [Rhododendron vialii]|uniref:probable folate-biopterin transporter 8, chloroplastic isoform X1 n=1 Tax=Rhododendron vialii TaxID=182163 RepID=UPI00265DAE07|nr:probable folate-biopterin transporter 8, chloroplastic isoform X1 [Rhododendron vialii]
MINPLVSNGIPLIPQVLAIQNPPQRPSFPLLRSIRCSNNPNPKTLIINPIRTNPDEVPPINSKKNKAYEERKGFSQLGIRKMLVLCGFGYWVQGFRGFPWLGLNFHMANNLNFDPSTLQLVQNTGNLPMVIKPLYGILSDALYIGRAHRIPYICIGVLLQVLSWGSLALIPFAREALPTLMGCVLLSNLGASITEVAKDALVAEYGQKQKINGLQSYAFMALAAGGILGNLLGGFFLLKTQEPKSIFLIFTLLLALQFAISLATREDSLGLPQPSPNSLEKRSISVSIRKQYSDLLMAISDESISRPLIWIVVSIATVPILSGSIFCYQIQCLHVDPSIIGMSRVTGQLMLLVITLLYDRFGKTVSMRKLIGLVQILYAASLLLDLVLVKQINLKLGIPNWVFALCFSGVAETITQFKLLPFQVLFASLAPPGCEGSLASLLASALCLASIVGGFLGVGLSSLLGTTSGDYASLPVGIVVQFLAALVPLGWIYHVSSSQPVVETENNRGKSKRTRRKRRVGRVVFASVYDYRRERESELHK